MSKKKWMVIYGVMGCAGILSMGMAAAVGSSPISMASVYQILGEHFFPWVRSSFDPTVDLIVWQIRFPRILLSFLVGGGLSVAGAAFQGLLRNPLADPYTLGVSSGASLGAVIALFFHIPPAFLGGFTLPLFSFAGALLSILLIYTIANYGIGWGMERLILTGIIISSFVSAFISLLISLSGEELRQIVFWLMGSFSMRGWKELLPIIPIILIGFLILLWKGRELDVMVLGEEVAKTVGVETDQAKRWIIIGASLVTAAGVAVAGVIGFVGLVVPHFIRLLAGPRHLHLLPLSFLGGGIFLIVSDTIARTISAPNELPIGVVTSLIGAPVFTYFLLRKEEGR
ncbi:FecCD family ABC transporter permease [Thermicanus aegyptius]|uniref:FecCD family ABC transporter permease n=1 Tax=Thermicanus aegyptius TaxID=94009 RepID=UPI00048F89A7|nr:iron ABC transporter permease [Thermicanus aegyptius]